MHEVRLHEKPGLAAAGTADHKDVLIPRILWQLRAAAHHQPFGLCQQDIVFKYRVYIGLYVLGVPPTGRTVLYILAVFLRVLALYIDNQPDKDSPGNADKHIYGVKARRE